MFLELCNKNAFAVFLQAVSELLQISWHTFVFTEKEKRFRIWN